MKTICMSILTLSSICIPNQGFATTDFSSSSSISSSELLAELGSTYTTHTKKGLLARTKKPKAKSCSQPRPDGQSLPSELIALRKHFIRSWTNDKENVYLTICHSNKLRFTKKCSTTIDGDNFCVEITCKRSKNQPNFGGESSIPHEIAFKVMLKNMPTKGVECTETTRAYYKLSEQGVCQMSISTYETKYMLKNVSLDVGQEPKFAKIEDGYDKFYKVVSFKILKG